MSGKEIRVVAGDRGGWNAIEPPLLKALDAGCNVSGYFTATCGKQVLDSKLKPDPRTVVYTDAGDLIGLREFLAGPHDLTVIGASQSEEGSRAGAEAIAMSPSPVLVMQDMYGSSMPTLAMLKEKGCESGHALADHIDRLCVTDAFARQLILDKYPELDNAVVVTGGPHFDKTIEMRRTWHERRQTLRQALGVSENQPVFLIAGGVNGTAEILHLLEEGIKQARVTDTAKVVLRVHPRATDDDKRLTKEYMETTKYPGWFTDVDRALAPTSDDLLPGMNFVLSGFSTTNYIGVLLQMPGVVYVGTPAFKKDLKAEKGLDWPPEVEIGAGWYVRIPDDMEYAITAVLNRERGTPSLLKIVDAQNLIGASNDGKATDRVWAEMQKLLQ